MSEDGPQSFSAEHHSRALLNILEDSAEEKQRLQDTQKAFLNILEDFGEEKVPQERDNASGGALFSMKDAGAWGCAMRNNDVATGS